VTYDRSCSRRCIGSQQSAAWACQLQAAICAFNLLALSNTSPNPCTSRDALRAHDISTRSMTTSDHKAPNLSQFVGAECRLEAI